MKIKYRFKLLQLFVISFLILIIGSCDEAFIDDGDPATGVNSSQNYLYIIEDGTKNLIMLDNNLNTLQRWDLSGLVGENTISGIACNDENLWISVAGNMDQIIKLASVGDSLMVLETMEAPPSGRGTIRDLAWDGANLWALNSGSISLGIPGQIFKINTNNNSIENEFDLDISNARGITYVGDNSDIYGRNIPKGVYITDVEEDMVCVLDERASFYEYFEAPLHPRGIHYTFPNAISYSDSYFYLINSSASSGNFLYILKHQGGAYNIEVITMLEFPFVSPTAIFWSDFDFRQGIESEILSVVPNTAKTGENLTVNINGRALKSDMTVSFGDGVTVNNTEYQNSTLIIVDITISGTAVVGNRDVILTDTNGDALMGESMFTIVEQNPLEGYILYCDNNDGSINKLRIADSTVVETWFPSFVDPSSLQGLEYYENSIWVSSAGTIDQIFEVDTSDMATVLNTLTAPPDQAGTIREMTFDSDGNMWVLNSSSGFIYKMDIEGNEAIDAIPTPNDLGNARGIVFVDGELYCNDKDTDFVYKYNFSTEIWAEAFELPVPPDGSTSNRFHTGMAWDGVNFWIANSTGVYDYLMQISPAGNLIQAILVPNSGDAQITGIAFTY